MLVCSACGAAPAPVPTPAPLLGVQGNSQSPTVELRVRAAAGARYATSSVVSFDAEVMGQSMGVTIENRSLRSVTEVRADGSMLIEDRSTSTITTQRLGSAPPVTTTEGPEDEATRAWMSPSGVRTPIETEAEAAPGSDQERMQGQLTALIESLMHGLEYPSGQIARGREWGSQGMLRLADVSPEMEGGILYQLSQRLDHVEGSGDSQVAVVGVELRIEGEGLNPGMGRLEGSVQIRGSYAVLVSDGFVHRLDLRFEGSATVAEALQVPLGGTLRYQADAIE